MPLALAASKAMATNPAITAAGVLLSGVFTNSVTRQARSAGAAHAVEMGVSFRLLDCVLSSD